MKIIMVQTFLLGNTVCRLMLHLKKKKNRPVAINLNGGAHHAWMDCQVYYLQVCNIHLLL